MPEGEDAPQRPVLVNLKITGTNAVPDVRFVTDAEYDAPRVELPDSTVGCMCGCGSASGGGGG